MTRLGESRAQLLLGGVAAARGDFGRAEGAREEALRLAQEAGASPEKVKALVGLGTTPGRGHGRHPGGAPAGGGPHPGRLPGDRFTPG